MWLGPARLHLSRPNIVMLSKLDPVHNSCNTVAVDPPSLSPLFRPIRGRVRLSLCWLVKLRHFELSSHKLWCVTNISSDVSAVWNIVELQLTTTTHHLVRMFNNQIPTPGIYIKTRSEFYNFCTFFLQMHIREAPRILFESWICIEELNRSYRLVNQYTYHR